MHTRPRSPGLPGALLVAALCTTPALGQNANPLPDGDALLRQRRYSEAMDRFEAVLATAPKDAAATRGEVAAAIAWAAEQAQGAYPEAAMETLERAMQRLPDQPVLLRSFGLEAISLGQFPIADQALHAAETLRPGDPTTTYALARLELEEQHLPDAERDLKAYLAAVPGDATAYFGLGHLYAMEQRSDEARRALEHSLALQPKQAESHYELGQLNLNEHHDAEAQVEYRRVLARNAQHAGALTGMGQLALRAKQYAEAERYLGQAEKSDPAYAPPHYYRGLALAKLGRTEEAQAELRAGDSRPHAAAADGMSSP